MTIVEIKKMLAYNVENKPVIIEKAVPILEGREPVRWYRRGKGEVFGPEKEAPIVINSDDSDDDLAFFASYNPYCKKRELETPENCDKIAKKITQSGIVTKFKSVWNEDDGKWLDEPVSESDCEIDVEFDDASDDSALSVVKVTNHAFLKYNRARAARRGNTRV